jgi:hypothetical protein
LSLVDAVRATSTPLYLIVDEYNRFANKLLFENPTLYGSVVMGESGKCGSSVLSSIFEAVKKSKWKLFGRYISLPCCGVSTARPQ